MRRTDPRPSKTWCPTATGWMVGRRTGTGWSRAAWWCGPRIGLGYEATRTLSWQTEAQVWPDAMSARYALRLQFHTSARIAEQGWRVVRVVDGVPASLPRTAGAAA